MDYPILKDETPEYLIDRLNMAKEALAKSQDIYSTVCRISGKISQLEDNGADNEGDFFEAFGPHTPCKDKELGAVLDELYGRQCAAEEWFLKVQRELYSEWGIERSENEL